MSVDLLVGFLAGLTVGTIIDRLIKLFVKSERSSDDDSGSFR